MPSDGRIFKINCGISTQGDTCAPEENEVKGVTMRIFQILCLCVRGKRALTLLTEPEWDGVFQDLNVSSGICCFLGGSGEGLGDFASLFCFCLWIYVYTHVCVRVHV